MLPERLGSEVHLAAGWVHADQRRVVSRRLDDAKPPAVEALADLGCVGEHVLRGRAEVRPQHGDAEIGGPLAESVV